MEKVIHSLDDLYQFLDPKVKSLVEVGQLGTVETSSNMSVSLYSRWKNGNHSPRSSTLLSFTQNLGIQMLLKDADTAEKSSSDQELQNQLDIDLVQLIHQLVASATLKDKILVRDFLIRLISED